MKKLESLSPEQLEKMNEVKNHWLNYIFSCKNSINREQAKISIDWLYKFCGLDAPIIIYMDSPMNCQYAAVYVKEYAKILKLNSAQVGAQVWAQVRDQVWAQVGAQVRDQVWDQVGAQVGDQVRAQVWAQVGDQGIEFENFASYGSVSDYGWVSFYDFFTQIGVIDNKDYNQFKNILSSGIYDMIQLNGFCIVCGMPNKIERNKENLLHSTTGSAISFKDGYSQYYVNGRSIKKETFEKVVSEEFTFEEFMKLENEDEKGIIITIIKENKGNEGLLNFLNAVKIDEQIVNHENGYSETLKLFKTKEKYSFLLNSKGEENQPYAWIQMVCPSTGTIYLIDTCPTFTNAIDCAKWHRPERIPQEIPYIWTSAN